MKDYGWHFIWTWVALILISAGIGAKIGVVLSSTQEIQREMIKRPCYVSSPAQK
jgi:hypothetical protein